MILILLNCETEVCFLRIQLIGTNCMFPKNVEEFFSARGPSSSAEVRGLVIHAIKEVEGVRQQEEQEDKRDEEVRDEVNGEVEEITHRAHETWGWLWDERRLKLEPKCACIKQGRQSKDNDSNWQQKRETTKTKDLQCMKTHALASTTLTCSPSVSGHFAHCWGAFRNSCRQFNCCRCNHLLNFWFGRESFVEIHSAKTGLLRSCLYTTLRLQQTAVSCERSNWNKIEKNTKNRESRSSEVLSKDGTQQVSPFYHIALHVSSLNDFLLIIVSSTRNHSIATNWRKNSMIGAIADTSRMAWAWVVIHQNLGVDGLM